MISFLCTSNRSHSRSCFLCALLLVWSCGLNLLQQVRSHNNDGVGGNSGTAEVELTQLLWDGKQAINQGQPDDVVEKMLWKAFETLPTRAEPLHILARYFREKNKHAKAYVYAQAAKGIPYPENDYLGIESHENYAVRSLVEIGIVSYYIGNYDEGRNANLEILHWHENGLFIARDTVERIRDNLKYYEGKALKPLPTFPQTIKTVKVDSTYYINLDDRLERRERMESTLEKLGFPYERFAAIGPKSTSMSMNMDEYIEHHKIQPSTEYEQSRGYTMSMGEIGCFMSHYSIMQDIIKKGHNVSIVFEDDVSFMPQFHSILPSVLEELEQLGDDLSWDVILLGRKKWVPGVEKRVPGSNYLVRPLFSLWAVGYLVSASGAAKIVDSKPLSKMIAFDDLLYVLADAYPRRPDLMDKLPFNRTFNLLAVKPGLVAGSEESDTQPGQTFL